MRSLLVLVLLAAPAHARPAPRPILPEATCYLAPAVYPEPDSTNVPLDAKAWVVASELREFDNIPYRLRWGKSERIAAITKHAPFDVIELNLGKLLPNQRYTLFEGNEAISTFTTGRALDSGAPRAPEIARAAAVDDVGNTSYFELELTADADRRFIELRNGDRVLVAPITTGLRLGTSCSKVTIDGKFCFEVRAIDLAGKRSEPTSHCEPVTQGPGMEPSSDSRYQPEPPEPMSRYPWRAALVVGLSLAVGAIAIAGARRRRSAKHLA